MSNKTIFPTDSKKIKDKIRRYERAFKDPHYDDGAGKRFLIGPLYLLMGDVPGAMKTYEWYEKEFPDDIPEAFNHLCWVLTLLRSGKVDLAKSRLRELIFENLYMIPVFLGKKPQQYPFRHSSNWSELSYILEGPRDELFSLWTPGEHEWIKEQWEDPKLGNDLSKYIELHQILDVTKSQEERRTLLKQISTIARG